MSSEIYTSALHYHRFPHPGKITITPSKALASQRDLALAYSPGVAAPCEEIAKEPLKVAEYTSRANLVAVISNGTAVLGLGNIGPLAAKPVMEGKAVLFKKFAGVDVFDIEIDEKDPDKLVDIIASLEPTFGGINLEDIKAPECFLIEKKLQERMSIPVFHDDQHGTAIVVAAAITNGLKLVGKRIEDVRLVTSGAGAAAVACVELLLKLGLDPKNVLLCDMEGVIYQGRPKLTDPNKLRFAAETASRTLADAVVGADIFLGLSVGGVLKEEMIATMASQPLILALANPTPEIAPDIVKRCRPDAIIATGRSDYPNQINNVLCFPFIFRGALDAGATSINDAMKLACVHAIASLAHEPAPSIVGAMYPHEELAFGPNYIIPKPFDPRLLMRLSPPVAQAAMDSGIATRPIADITAYARHLSELTSDAARALALRLPKDASTASVSVVYSHGEDVAILESLDDTLLRDNFKPILVGEGKVFSEHAAFITKHQEAVTLAPTPAATLADRLTTAVSLAQSHHVGLILGPCDTSLGALQHYASIISAPVGTSALMLKHLKVGDKVVTFGMPLMQERASEEDLVELLQAALKRFPHEHPAPRVAVIPAEAHHEESLHTALSALAPHLSLHMLTPEGGNAAANPSHDIFLFAVRSTGLLFAQALAMLAPSALLAVDFVNLSLTACVLPKGVTARVISDITALTVAAVD